jgi:energy-converting hydrogenase Eha subunit G
MSISQVFWVLYVAGMTCIFLASGAFSPALLVFSGAAFVIYVITLMGGTHNG